MEPWESAAVRYRFKFDHAKRVERVLQWLGWTVAVLATRSPVGFVSLWMAGRLTGGQAVGASFATIVGSILSGASADGSGVSVGLGAERLEVAASLARDLPDSHEPRAGES
jgi:hypothetical protein